MRVSIFYECVSRFFPKIQQEVIIPVEFRIGVPLEHGLDVSQEALDAVNPSDDHDLENTCSRETLKCETEHVPKFGSSHQ